MPAGFIEFLESHLGEMAGGSHFAESPATSVNVVRFENQPVANAVTYVTTGMSHHSLHQLEGPELRVELMGCVWSRFRESGFDALLYALAEETLARHHAPSEGSVVGPRGPIVDGSELEAFIFLSPFYFDESFGAFDHESEPVLLIWPVPITAAEAAFVAEEGWDEFERLLLSRDPDLLDLHRPSIVPKTASDSTLPSG